MLNVAKYGALGIVGGTIAGAAIKPKTQSGEHTANRLSTAVGLGTLAATPYLVKNIVTKSPKTTEKVAIQAGKTIEKGIEYTAKLGKKIYNSNFVQKNCKGLYDKFSKSNIGSKIISKITEIGKKVLSNDTVKKVVTKASDALQKFSKAPTAQKGLYGLAAAGVAFLAYAGIKTITNYYKKEGAIDQKYKDMRVMDNYLV